MNLLNIGFWSQLEYNDYQIYNSNGIMQIQLTDEILVYIQKDNINSQLIFQTINNHNIIGKWCFQFKFKHRNEWTEIMYTPVYTFNLNNHLTCVKRINLNDYSDIYFEWMEIQ